MNPTLAYEWLAPKLSTPERQALDVLQNEIARLKQALAEAEQACRLGLHEMESVLQSSATEQVHFCGDDFDEALNALNAVVQPLPRLTPRTDDMNDEQKCPDHADGTHRWDPSGDCMGKNCDVRRASARPVQSGAQETITAMVDCAMVEMQNIHPPLRRNECERLIRAALSAAPPAADAEPKRCQQCDGIGHAISPEVDEQCDHCDGTGRAAPPAAVPFVDPTDPGHDVEVLREHVRHLERQVRRLAARPAPAEDAEPAAWMEPSDPPGYVSAEVKARWVRAGYEHLPSAYSVPLYTRPAAPLSEAPTEAQIIEAAHKAGLWPNTVHTWIPAFHRYHAALAAMRSTRGGGEDGR